MDAQEAYCVRNDMKNASVLVLMTSINEHQRANVGGGCVCVCVRARALGLHDKEARLGAQSIKRYNFSASLKANSAVGVQKLPNVCGLPIAGQLEKLSLQATEAELLARWLCASDNPIYTLATYTRQSFACRLLKCPLW